jgi:segregation and condensation protein B
LEKTEAKRAIEGLLFVSDVPLTPEKIRSVLSDMSVKEIKSLLAELVCEYDARNGGFFLAEVAQGYQFRTKPECAPWIQKFRKSRPLRFSRATFETLAIIAYRQPVTKAEIEAIRGVDCSGVLHNLMEKKVVHILGRKDVPGRPFLFGTTPRFLEIFGLEKLSSLPLMEAVGEDTHPPTPTEESTS